ncbi:hypothetical protein [Prevotella sp. 10(H)]|uniref:hypothetical protein n=1 Tax=Prevotella sp. 10(H) TaxID=1158294 RepID=UPI0004A7075A|nr:hypothetical protein [Prevotella sp. 10(H)]
MKIKLTILALCLVLPVVLSAQISATKAYLFDEFTKGKVVYKAGASSEALFNYNSVNEKILFLSDTTVMELVKPDIVAYVSIGDRIFEHIKGNTFYEKVKAGDTDLYIQWRSTVVSKGKQGAYGGTQNTSGVQHISHLTTDLQTHKIKIKEDFEVKPQNAYYINIKNKFKRFGSVNALASLFKGHEEQIKQYAKDENINFDDPQNVAKIVAYCGQFY